MPGAYAACGPLNTASRHTKHHPPCNTEKNFMCFFFLNNFFSICSKKKTKLPSFDKLHMQFFWSLFVCFFSAKFLSSPLLDMTINQLKPLITW